MQWNGKEPIYQQLKNKIAAAIMDGSYEEGWCKLRKDNFIENTELLLTAHSISLIGYSHSA